VSPGRERRASGSKSGSVSGTKTIRTLKPGQDVEDLLEVALVTTLALLLSWFKHLNTNLYEIVRTIEVSTISLSDHVTWRLVQQNAGNYSTLYRSFHLGQSEYWIFCVSLATHTYIFWHDLLSRICQSNRHQLKRSVDMVFPIDSKRLCVYSSKGCFAQKKIYNIFMTFHYYVGNEDCIIVILFLHSTVLPTHIPRPVLLSCKAIQYNRDHAFFHGFKAALSPGLNIRTLITYSFKWTCVAFQKGALLATTEKLLQFYGRFFFLSYNSRHTEVLVQGSLRK